MAYLSAKQILTMINYIKISVPVTSDEQQEILLALLSEEGYDGFEETTDALNAYISEEQFDQQQLEELLQPFSLSYTKEVIAPKNWNAEWESNYEPVVVDEFVAVRAHFHQTIATVQHEIVITPKMSFGTGHHATTWQVMKLMQGIDFSNKTVFDFGCGTAVLAILAEKLGATSVLAVDNDDWCIENSLENVATNNCTKIVVQKADVPSTHQFDIILANINRHILLQYMVTMAASLNNKGYIIISGFYKDENQLLIDAATAQQLQLITASDRNNWSALLFQKIA
ncbi:50S ribosomal protein L11 methyltransferase [Lacibacter luteus]|nr:50S ribosomal protein L11 methyltransferase [Lacibacter luteus]